MERNVSAFPAPPDNYKQKLQPPKPPEEGEFSMFGRTYTTKEVPLKIETSNIQLVISDADLQDPLYFQRSLLTKLQLSLMIVAHKIIKALAENPSQAVLLFHEYERITITFHQLLYWMRPLQAMHLVKQKLIQQTENKEKAKNELLSTIQELKEELADIIEN